MNKLTIVTFLLMSTASTFAGNESKTITVKRPGIADRWLKKTRTLIAALAIAGGVTKDAEAMDRKQNVGLPLSSDTEFRLKLQYLNDLVSIAEGQRDPNLELLTIPFARLLSIVADSNATLLNEEGLYDAYRTAVSYDELDVNSTNLSGQPLNSDGGIRWPFVTVTVNRGMLTEESFNYPILNPVNVHYEVIGSRTFVNTTPVPASLADMSWDLHNYRARLEIATIDVKSELIVSKIDFASHKAIPIRK